MVGLFLRNEHQPLLGQLDCLLLHGRSGRRAHVPAVAHGLLLGIVKPPEGNGAEDKEGKQPRRKQ